MTIGTLLALLALQAASRPTEEPPSAIARMLESRAALRAADISWAVRNGASANTPDSWFSRQMRFVDGDVAYFDQGADGVTGFTESGEPVHEPVNELWSRDGHWEYGLGEVYAKKNASAARPSHVPDFRSIALVPERMDTSAPRELIAAYPAIPGAERRWRQREVDGKYEVELEVSDLVTRWSIDPARGWNATRCELRRDGRVVRLCECTLRDFDGTWFPESVRYFFDGKPEPQIELRITDAKFDRSPPARPLTPADIGVEPGMWVNIVGAADGAEPQVWAGDRLVGASDFLRLLRDGQVQRGPTVQAFIDRTRAIVHEAQRSHSPADASPPDAGEPSAASRPARGARDLSEWEQYTRDFIQRFALNRDQMEKAIQILADCQRQGNDYLTRKADDFARLERRLSELRASGAAAPATRESENALTQLHQPLRDIFEKQLKPRLERIPTAAQRSAAAAAAPTREPARPPATQPAKSDRP